MWVAINTLIPNNRANWLKQTELIYYEPYSGEVAFYCS